MDLADDLPVKAGINFEGFSSYGSELDAFGLEV